MPTHFLGGVSDAAQNSMFFDMPANRPNRLHSYFNDFNTFAVADWTITTTEAGASSASEALTDEQFGALLGNVAGIDDLIKLAPAAGGAGRLFGGLASALGGSQGALLANIVGGFSQLGLTPDHAKRFAPVMLDFVRSHAGADAAAQLEAALRAGR